jgi:iron complex transport system ATP-binding protein
MSIDEGIIKIQNITVKYGDYEVLNNIYFNIKKGEFTSIIGPNGAGKSTILKAIMKNIELSSGDIIIKDKSIIKMSHKEKASIIGFVPQEYNISFDFTVYEIVAMGRNPYTTKFKKSKYDDNKIIEESLKKTNTYEFKDKYFNSLSGGEKQRVIIARALAQQPEILILDEATSSLDIHHQLDILELIHSLNREDGLTVITIMHDLNLASRFSDNIILLSKNGIIKQGKPSEVIDENVLKNVYDMDMVVRENKLLSYTEIIPLRIRKSKENKNIHIHVICGGGTGEYILQKLYSERYEISCGILIEGDSDLDLCRSLNLDFVAENPFSKFSEDSINKNKEFIDKSDIIILTDVAIGHGNFDNIKMIENIRNKKIIILHSVNRDFVDGEYEKMLEKITKQDNVKYAMNLKELFGFL